MTDVLQMLIVFGSFLGAFWLFFRHRYRMKLLATVQIHPGLLAGLHPPSRAAGADPSRHGELDVRLEALEEKLEWLERLVQESANERVRVAPERPPLAAASDGEARVLARGGVGAVGALTASP